MANKILNSSHIDGIILHPLKGFREKYIVLWVMKFGLATIVMNSKKCQKDVFQKKKEDSFLLSTECFT